MGGGAEVGAELVVVAAVSEVVVAEGAVVVGCVSVGSRLGATVDVVTETVSDVVATNTTVSFALFPTAEVGTWSGPSALAAQLTSKKQKHRTRSNAMSGNSNC